MRLAFGYRANQNSSLGTHSHFYLGENYVALRGIFASKSVLWHSVDTFEDSFEKNASNGMDKLYFLSRGQLLSVSDATLG